MKQHSVAGDDAQQSRIQENHLQGMAGIRNLKGDNLGKFPLVAALSHCLFKLVCILEFQKPW